jgi:hypothetical protein
MSFKSKLAVPLLAAFAFAGCATVPQEKPQPLQEFKALTGEARMAFWECVAIKTVDPDLEDLNKFRKKIQSEGEVWNERKEGTLRDVLANIRCAQEMKINPDTLPALQ